jgi:SAM-dependent methyltransferase
VERKQIIDWRTKSSEKKINFFPGFYKEGMNVLEVGAGTGSFLNQLKTRFKCAVTGVEPSHELRKIAEEAFGIELISGTLEVYAQTHTERRMFDMVVLDQVVEHLYRPLEALQTCRQLIKDDGYIYVGVPNASTPAHPIAEFFIPEHILTFTPYTIMLLLWRAGFKIIKIVTPEASPLHVIATPIENSKENQLPLSAIPGPFSADQLQERFAAFGAPSGLSAKQ